MIAIVGAGLSELGIQDGNVALQPVTYKGFEDSERAGRKSCQHVPARNTPEGELTMLAFG